MAVEWYGPAIIARVRAATGRGLMTGIGMVEARAVELIMNPPKTGRIYRRRGVTHQASAGGESPANDTGRLVGSRRVILDMSKLRATLNFSTEYARKLELGTPKMEPRPYARRALAERRKDAHGAVLAEIAQELRR